MVSHTLQFVLPTSDMSSLVRLSDKLRRIHPFASILPPSRLQTYGASLLQLRWRAKHLVCVYALRLNDWYYGIHSEGPLREEDN
jgi:hypothetical protein